MMPLFENCSKKRPGFWPDLLYGIKDHYHLNWVVDLKVSEAKVKSSM